MNSMLRIALAASAAAFALAPSTALADDDEVKLVQCEQSLGTIALVDSPSAGWNQWELGSPRMLVSRLASESGCFTPHDGTSDTPAQFLVTAIAGTQEEVDQGINLATGVATEALVRSGAASGLLSSVPFGGAAIGLLGGLGGRRTTVAAALTVVSPATGQPLAAGNGSVSRSSLSFRGSGGAYNRGLADTVGYGDSSNGRKLTEAFIIAFNQLVDQRAALAAAPVVESAPAAGPREPAALVAVDTVMRAAPDAGSDEIRTLREGTQLSPVGGREGLWLEVSDNYGTRGWVSVEDLL